MRVELTSDELSVVYDVLRFGREEFRDENGLGLSDAELGNLEGVIDRLELGLPNAVDLDCERANGPHHSGRCAKCDRGGEL